MSAARRGDAGQASPGAQSDLPTPSRHTQAGAAPRHYVVFRATRRADGSASSFYEVPEAGAQLDGPGFNAWVAANVPGGRATDMVSVLVIDEVLDRHGSIVTCCLERRLGSATGPLHGDPARVTFIGAVKQLRAYQAAARGTLWEVVPPLDRRTLPPSRVRHLAGEEAVIRSIFGAATRILDARESTLLEDLVSLTSVMHLRLPNGVEIDCGLGWHGTTPFVLQAEFPRFDAAAELPAVDAASVAVAAIAAGLTTFETRLDAQGPAVVARSLANGGFHMIRPSHGAARIEAYTPEVPATLFNADQAIWARYAQAHEHLLLLDAYQDGRSDNVFVISAAPDGSIIRHMVDADGVEVWRAAANDTAIADLHRQRVTGAVED